MPARKLSLKRDVLQELTTDELNGVVGGTKTVKDTLYSCMTFISCNILDCVATFDRCIETN